MIEISISGLDPAVLRRKARGFNKLLAKNIKRGVRAKSAQLYSAAITAMDGQRKNRPLTLLLKKGTSPLRDMGRLAKRGNYRIVDAKPGSGVVGVAWGIPASVSIGASATATSSFRSMADLVFWLNGSRNLRKPLYRIIKVTEGMAKLFQILSGATRKRRRAAKKGRMALTGRAKELLDSANGREITPLKKDSIIVVRPRPFLQDAVMSMKKELEVVVIEALDETVRQIVAEAKQSTGKK